jgi:hypothetical protein
MFAALSDVCVGLAECGLLLQIHVLISPIVGTDAEIRLPLQVSQRRDGAHTLQRQLGAAEHDRSVVRRTIGVLRTMT